MPFSPLSHRHTALVVGVHVNCHSKGDTCVLKGKINIFLAVSP